MSILWLSLMLSLQSKGLLTPVFPPIHTNQTFTALLGCEGHTSPLWSFHHPCSQLHIELPPTPALLDLQRTKAPSLVPWTLQKPYTAPHPATYTGQRGVRASSQLVYTSHGGVLSITGYQKHLLSLVCSGCSCRPLHNVLNPEQ